MDPTAPPVSPLEKPLPNPSAKRPGTSGTELGLRANRRAASTAFQRAQKAEQAYRAKRQATNARDAGRDAKAHFRESGVQFLAGWRKGVCAVKCVPGVLREKRGNWNSKREVRGQEKALAKRKKLEEKMKRVEKEGEGEAVVPAEGEVVAAEA
ncbi:hypothetical protein LCER1_G000823 [Lachnellula cervina]|uniref:Uncharacterized protein n=1 Tax=Lachnellula cervina TaxID=1316786 RepID=A0A7D8YTW4_9HELO|nr:hypothetical protein LCER1_G000823 [Lachnellula cervina]